MREAKRGSEGLEGSNEAFGLASIMGGEPLWILEQERNRMMAFLEDY